MMVTEVRGHFKNVRGWMELDEADPLRGSVEVTIDARGIWTGGPERDAHLRSADFLDVERQGSDAPGRRIRRDRAHRTIQGSASPGAWRSSSVRASTSLAAPEEEAFVLLTLA